MDLTGSCGPTPILAVHGINKKFSSLGLKNRSGSENHACDHLFMTYIVFIFIYIYVDVCCFSSIFLCIVSSLSLYTCFFMYAILYFYFTLRCLNEFCLKCFRKTGCENLSCHELSSCKVFQEFVLRLDFIVFSSYEFSDLRLLS